MKVQLIKLPLRYTLIGLLLMTAFSSCRVSKTYHRPNTDTLLLYRDEHGTDTITMASMHWDQLFADTALQGLIREGLANNLSLKIAIQRIAEAQSFLTQARGAMLPSLGGAATATHSKQSVAALNFPSGLINTKTTSYQLGLSSSWEVDVWGKLNSAKKAALANLLETQAARRAVQTQLIADIANNYYTLLAYDSQLEITQRAVEYRIKDVEAMKALKDAGIVTGAAVVQSEANRYGAEATIPDLKRSIRETENALDLLLGRPPGPITRGNLDQQQPTTNLQTGIPAQLLQNRPDVQEAEFAFRAAFENTNAARTYFYPRFTVTSAGGVSSLALKDLFVNSIFYNIAAGLTEPIFSQGVNKARLRTARAQQMEALNNFQFSLLNASNDVSNALYSYQSAVEKDSSRTREIAALVKSVDYSEQLLRYSSATNYTDVLTSEQTLLAAQLNGVGDRLQQLQAVVNLYRALGGGWR